MTIVVALHCKAWQILLNARRRTLVLFVESGVLMDDRKIACLNGGYRQTKVIMSERHVTYGIFLSVCTNLERPNTTSVRLPFWARIKAKRHRRAISVI